MPNQSDLSLLQCVKQVAQRLTQAGVAFGHGTTNAFDEAAWLVLWQLGLALDAPLQTPRKISPTEQMLINQLVDARIKCRQPAAYLTQEAWLQGVAFYVDQRAIVPRSLIAELLVDGALDYWLSASTKLVLDLCTGNASLAVLAAMAYPETTLHGCDISADALEVARINVARHQLQQRITLHQGNGLTAVAGHRFDLILCNPPYVNAHSMANLPAEFKAEPELALAGGTDGMDLIRQLLQDAPAHMSEHAVLVLEIGNERKHFEAAFPQLPAIWLQTSAGEDQVLLLTRQALLSQDQSSNQAPVSKQRHQ